MNIEEAVQLTHSKTQVNRIIHFIGNDEELFKVLMKFVLGEDKVMAQRAVWPMSYIGIEHPLLIKPYQLQLFKLLQKTDTHDAINRNILRLWMEVMPPQKYWAMLFDYCLLLLKDANQPIAVKAFAMRVMGNIAVAYPELKPELRHAIQYILINAKPAILSSAKKTLKLIDKC